MAIFHLHIKHIGRSDGRSAVSASAYRSASNMVELSEGGDVMNKYNFQNKKGVVFSKVFAPEESSVWMNDREALWNIVQNKFDTRVNSVFAQEIDVALPMELSQEENEKLLCKYVEEILVREGIVADVNIHMDNPDNPHAHLMLSTRQIIGDGNRDYTFGKKVRYWDRREFLLHLRQNWASYVNKHLFLKGLDLQVSHLSHKERNIVLKPTIKKGVGRIIENFDRQRINAEVKRENEKKIIENPGIIVSAVSNSKSLFTRKDIEHEINKYSCENDILLIKSILDSNRVVYAGFRDLNGRIVYKDRLRSNLEKSFHKLLEEIRDENNDEHNLRINLNIPHKKNLVQKDVGSKESSLALSKSQREAVMHIINSGNISLLEGIAGSGKTTIIREVTNIYRKHNRQIIASAVSSNAANILGDAIGIKALNTTKLRYEIQQKKGFNLRMDLDSDLNIKEQSMIDSNSILIIDEASMVDLAEMHYFVSIVQKVGAKLILIGDRNQFSAIRLKGAYEQIAKYFKPVTLSEVKRQIVEQHREASAYIANNNLKGALNIYHSNHNIVFANDKLASMQKLSQDYINAFLSAPKEKMQALSYTRGYVSELNQMIRENLKLVGHLGKEIRRFKLNDNQIREFALGDKVIFTRNDKRLGINNNERGTLVGFQGSNLKIRLDKYKSILSLKVPVEIIVDNRFYKDLDYAYATTFHKAQGATYDKTFILFDKNVNYNAFTVLATRHRKDFKLYISEDVLARNDTTESRIDSILHIISKQEISFFEKDFENLDNAEILEEYIEAKSLVYKLVSSGPYSKDEILPALHKRKIIAAKICDNYHQYAHHLNLADITYQLLAKHAGRSEGLKEHTSSDTSSYSDSFIMLLGHLGKFLKIPRGALFDIDRGSISSKIFEASQKLAKIISDQENKIYELEIDLEKKVQFKSHIEYKISSIRNYLDVILPNFIASIFKEDSKEVLSNWDELMSESKNLDDAIHKYRRNPQILGSRLGKGIGYYIAFTEARANSNSNFQNLESRLKLYEQYRHELHKLEISKIDIQNIYEITSEIRKEKSYLMPNREKEFVTDIEDLRMFERSEENLNSFTIKQKQQIDFYQSKYIKSRNSPKHLSKDFHSLDFEAVFRQYAPQINPDGKIKVTDSHISIGSLTMNLENGLWHRFSTSDGGNIHNFLNLVGKNSLDISSRKPAQIVQKTHRNNKKIWRSFEVIPQDAPKFNPKVHISFLLRGKELEDIYGYRNKEGKVIGYTIRIREGDSKSIIPVSYCYLSEKQSWRMQGFTLSDGSKPIYGMEKLQKDKPILIVEGEKTADAAEKLFEDYNVISWLRGASGADKVNWSVLKDREVMIWPDNDKVGINIARLILNKLGNINNSYHKTFYINTKALRLPEKWDLADKVPEELSNLNLRQILSDTKDSFSTKTDPNFATEKERRIYWQSWASGILLNHDEVRNIALEEEKYYRIFDSSSCRDYTNYMKVRNDIEKSHEFLNIRHEFYKEILTSIAMKEQYDTSQKAETLLDITEEKFTSKLANFTDHLPYIEKFGAQLKGKKSL